MLITGLPPMQVGSVIIRPLNYSQEGHNQLVRHASRIFMTEKYANAARSNGILAVPE